MDLIRKAGLTLKGGKDFEIYDRIYLNDHYGVEGDHSYLPEVVVTPQGVVKPDTYYQQQEISKNGKNSQDAINKDNNIFHN
jgi:hypothetical protein